MIPNRYAPEDYNASSAKALEEICQRAHALLISDNKLDVQFGSVIYTCAVKFLDVLAHYLAEHPEECIDVSSLLRFSVENREDSKSEKAGNIVPVVEIGERFKLSCKNDYGTEEEDS